MAVGESATVTSECKKHRLETQVLLAFYVIDSIKLFLLHYSVVFSISQHSLIKSECPSTKHEPQTSSVNPQSQMLRTPCLQF